MFKKNVATTGVVLLIATYILNIIDYIQTVYAIQFCGLCTEANPIFRFCFEHNFAGVVKFIVVPIIMVLLGLIITKVDTRQIWAACALFVFYIIVVWHNFAELMKMGILTLNQFEWRIMSTTLFICAIYTTTFAITYEVLCAYYIHFNEQ